MGKICFTTSLGSLSLFLASSCIAAITEVQSVRLTNLLIDNETAVADVRPDLQGQIDSMFANISCKLPAKLKKKLDENKANASDAAAKNKPFVPNDLLELLNRHGIFARKVASVSEDKIQAVLTRVFFVDSEGKPSKIIPLTGATAFDALDVDGHRYTGRGDIGYSLDCSGYLTAALSVAGKWSFFSGGVDLSNESKAVLEGKESILLASARYYSPSAIAFNPGLVNENTRNRIVSARSSIDILVAILIATNKDWIKSNNTSIPESTLIAAPATVRVLWLASSKTSKTQGEVDMSVGANGFGVLKTENAAKTSLARSLSYSDYRTFILDDADDVVPESPALKYENIRSLVKELIKASPYVLTKGKVGVAFRDIPGSVCSLPFQWKMTFSQNGTGKETPVDSKMDRDLGCIMEPRESLKGGNVTFWTKTGFGNDSDKIELTVTIP